MAVPKHRRYKQLIQSRRSINKINKLKNYNIIKQKYSNFSFIDIHKKDVKYEANCCYCRPINFKKVCLNCYTSHFKGAYVKYINKK